MLVDLIPNSLPHSLKALLIKEIPAKGLTLLDIFCNFIPKKLSFLFVLFEITKIGEFFQSSKHCIIFIHNVL
jgi:hypothetical protein